MNCTDVSEHLLDVLYGDADPAVRRDVDDHVSRCAACAAQLDSLRRTIGTLDAWTPLERPVPGHTGRRESGCGRGQRDGFVRQLPERRQFGSGGC